MPIFPSEDVSDWIMHFIHNRNPEYERFPEDCMDEDLLGNLRIPVHFEPQINRLCDNYFASMANHDYLPGDASAMQVLIQILNQGFIRSTWSIRSERATIYGPKAAVCFTDMPLSSLVEYANNRLNAGAVQPYAIGLLKEDLFRAGGRPVIYGLSGTHAEIHAQNRWPRFLHPDCGIGETEQYRYVAFNLNEDRPIDWTHEREWRWADHGGLLRMPGLPVWRYEINHLFTRALLVVQSEAEVRTILNLLQRLLDARVDALENPYFQPLLRATAVISLEQLRQNNLLIAGSALRLEDIPHHLTRSLPIALIPEHEQAGAWDVINQALLAARAAAEHYASEHGDYGPVGFAELVIDDSLADFTRAAQAAGLLSPTAGIDPQFSGGYWVPGVTDSATYQSLEQQQVAASAAMESIRTHFPALPMHIYSRLD